MLSLLLLMFFKFILKLFTLSYILPKQKVEWESPAFEGQLDWNILCVRLNKANIQHDKPYFDFLIFFGTTGIWTQGFVLGRQGTVWLEPCLQAFLL
jgi:hypothetical protein